jgi:hypothetical protein
MKLRHFLNLHLNLLPHFKVQTIKEKIFEKFGVFYSGVRSRYPMSRCVVPSHRTMKFSWNGILLILFSVLNINSILEDIIMATLLPTGY